MMQDPCLTAWVFYSWRMSSFGILIKVNLISNKNFKMAIKYDDIKHLDFDRVESYDTIKYGKIPKKTYKYLDLSKSYNRDCLKDDYVYFSDPMKLNDPFDKPLPVAYYLLRKDIDVFKNYFSAHLKSECNFMTEIEIEEEVLRDQQNCWANDDNIEFFDNFHLIQSSIQDRMATEIGVFSTCFENDNICLWSHYANNHTGICLGISTFKLLRQHSPQVGVFPIKYGPHPIIIPFDESNVTLANENFESIMATKALCWENEREYRFLDCKIDKREKPLGDALESLTLGCAISQVDKDFAIKYCKMINPNIEIFQAGKVPFEFNLEIVQLDI